MEKNTFNGYQKQSGSIGKRTRAHFLQPANRSILLEARAAIAQKQSTLHHTVTPSDVFIASSYEKKLSIYCTKNNNYSSLFYLVRCSAAIDMVIAVLADEGKNILIPDPGWSHYNTLLSSRGVHLRPYPLLPERY